MPALEPEQEKFRASANKISLWLPCCWCFFLHSGCEWCHRKACFRAFSSQLLSISCRKALGLIRTWTLDILWKNYFWFGAVQITVRHFKCEFLLKRCWPLARIYLNNQVQRVQLNQNTYVILPAPPHNPVPKKDLSLSGKLVAADVSPAFLHMHTEARRGTSVFQEFFFSKTWLVHKNFN